MTTAYTSLLGLALPVTGELQGTWGDTVNNSITSLLDTAVAGTTTLSTDSDVTLTTTTGATNQSRQAIILWTASGTTTRNITAPAQSKIYTVINNTGSTQSIVIRGVGPTTGVTIPAGCSATVAWNGSDFVDISGTRAGMTLRGNLLFSADNTYDIGASGATRPRNLYLAGLLTMGGALTVNGNTTLGDASSDTLTVNATANLKAQTAFGILGSSGQYAVSLNPDVASTSVYWIKNNGTSLIFGSGGNPYSGETNNLFLYGNVLGLGQQPVTTWYSGTRAVQVYASSIYASGDDLNMASNTYLDASGNPRYIDQYAYASKYNLYNGAHTWSVTSSTQGAGNAITWTDAMTLTRSGNLTVGSLPTSKRLTVTEAADGDGIVLNHSGRATSTYWLMSLSGVNNENLAFNQYNGSSLAAGYVAGRSTHLWYINDTQVGTFANTNKFGVGVSSPATYIESVGQVFGDWTFAVTASQGGSSAAADANIQYGWAASSARTGWAKAGSGYACYYSGSNNTYLTWNLLCFEATSLYIYMTWCNNADSISRTSAVDYSLDGGSSWTNLGTITFGASGGSPISGTLSIGTKAGRNVQIRAYWVSGATASPLIGVGNVTFTTHGGGFQFINSLG